jgi:type I restriction enzyme S subunit
MPNLSTEILARLPLSLPEYDEQRKIAALLTTWGRAIDATECLIAAKQQRRKWLMQQLLTGKRRFGGFSERWRTVHLREIVEPVSRRVPKPAGPYGALGIRSHCKGTFSRVVDKPEAVVMEELYVARADDLIVNITFAWEGAIAIVPAEHDGLLVSHRFPTFRAKPDRVYLDYLRYLVRQQRFIFLLGLISPGGAGRNRVLSKRDFLELRVSLPSLAEQEKIARILRMADAETSCLTEIFEALREQKKGLMQQLLTGKRRVKREA